MMQTFSFRSDSGAFLQMCFAFSVLCFALLFQHNLIKKTGCRSPRFLYFMLKFG